MPKQSRRGCHAEMASTLGHAARICRERSLTAAGAANRVFDLGPVGVGQARHTGVAGAAPVPFKV
jgi:hypothetical protein